MSVLLRQCQSHTQHHTYGGAHSRNQPPQGDEHAARHGVRGTEATQGLHITALFEYDKRQRRDYIEQRDDKYEG